MHYSCIECLADHPFKQPVHSLLSSKEPNSPKMSTVASPSRRVFGDKNPNAHLQTQSPHRRTKQSLDLASPVQSSLKRPLSPSYFPLFSPRAGQKRRIEDVNEEEPTDSQTTNTQPWSPITDVLMDSSSDQEDTSRTSIAQTKSTPATTFTSSSFYASQDEQSQPEVQFQIHDEPSQQTLDKMVGSTDQQEH